MRIGVRSQPGRGFETAGKLGGTHVNDSGLGLPARSVALRTGVREIIVIFHFHFDKVGAGKVLGRNACRRIAFEFRIPFEVAVNSVFLNLNRLLEN